MNNSETALVFETQRFSTEDGPGIRTTVFLKGCPLKCTWCHNPESIKAEPEIHWLGSRCIGCHTCVDTCAEGALSFCHQGLVIDREICNVCGSCVDNCPSTALEIIGTRWNMSDLVAEVKKDAAYYRTSGGGVTVSGGEPTFQPSFVAGFLSRLQNENIHTAVDTCGLCSRRTLETLLPYADLVLFDIKLIDAGLHKTYTGSDNRIILENFETTAEYTAKRGSPRDLWVRTPIIPGATAHHDNISAIGNLIAAAGHGAVSRWELCAFNNLCADKYQRLDRTWNFAEASPLTAGAMDALADTARSSGADPTIVCWTGSTGSESETNQKEKSRRPALEVIDGEAGQKSGDAI